MRKYTTSLCLTALLLAVVRAEGAGPRARAGEPREIVVAGLPSWREDARTEIPNEKKLAEAVPNQEARGAILKQVDFRKERLLLFSWQGSGSDRLTVRRGKKAGEVTFEFTPGSAKNEAKHVKLFAVPAKAKVTGTPPI